MNSTIWICFLQSSLQKSIHRFFYSPFMDCFSYEKYQADPSRGPVLLAFRHNSLLFEDSHLAFLYER